MISVLWLYKIEVLNMWNIGGFLSDFSLYWEEIFQILTESYFDWECVILRISNKSKMKFSTATKHVLSYTSFEEREKNLIIVVSLL